MGVVRVAVQERRIAALGKACQDPADQPARQPSALSARRGADPAQFGQTRRGAHAFARHRDQEQAVIRRIIERTVEESAFLRGGGGAEFADLDALLGAMENFLPR